MDNAEPKKRGRTNHFSPTGGEYCGGARGDAQNNSWQTNRWHGQTRQSESRKRWRSFPPGNGRRKARGTASSIEPRRSDRLRNLHING
ncbi:hypothetical protein RDWZM_010338 [Blomia tropicalis]|uniref:Uncharacterized protein n=1 Tax=Blomia tropicalis TaxID=40697 RepID=A0A9Q0LWK3_BLOTA|nr:hypothetical protein RDWZM_010338 [Blomia tropicalis]